MFLSLNVVLIVIVNSVDIDEMQHNATFHLGLHCLPKYPFRTLQYIQRVNIDQWFKSVRIYNYNLLQIV